MTSSPIELLLRVTAMLEELGIEYALGGSLASSMFGEPRSTADIDVAISVDEQSGTALIERATLDFYLPTAAARRAVRDHDSFNLIDSSSGLKVDLFVIGDEYLDLRQIERRIPVVLDGSARTVWVTSPEDQILRKLTWYLSTNNSSERQWRDVISILRISRDALDLADLRDAASELGITDLLERALADADERRR